MREDMRRRLREFAESTSTPKTGVTGVTAAVTPAKAGALHQPLHLAPLENNQHYQSCNTVTPVTPAKTQGGEIRYTRDGDTEGVTSSFEAVLRPSAQPLSDPEDWLAFYEERAGILEFDGGLDRADAERRALVATVAALGPRPRVH